jgi:hypothetical protein
MKEGWFRMKWLEDVESHLQGLKVRRWMQKANDREELLSVIKEAMVPRGPLRQDVKR